MVAPWLIPGLIGAAGGLFAGRRGARQERRERRGGGIENRKFEPLRWRQRHLLNKLAGHFNPNKLDITHKGLYQKGYQHLSDLLSNDEEAFKKFEAPYLRKFNEQVVPGIAERFTQFGEGGQQSSAFSQALAQAAAGLTENLAAMRSGMQQQALPEALQYLSIPQQMYSQRAGMALGAPGIHNIAIQKNPPAPGFFQNIMGGLGGGLGGGIGMAAGGPIGGAFGAGIGQGIGNMFGGGPQMPQRQNWGGNVF